MRLGIFNEKRGAWWRWKRLLFEFGVSVLFSIFPLLFFFFLILPDLFSSTRLTWMFFGFPPQCPIFPPFRFVVSLTLSLLRPLVHICLLLFYFGHTPWASRDFSSAGRSSLAVFSLCMIWRLRGSEFDQQALLWFCPDPRPKLYI